MRDPKLLLLALLSVCLVATWVYHLYDKTLYSQRLIEKIPVRDSAAIATAISDSLQQIYSASLVKLDSGKLTADLMNEKLRSRVEELNRFKAEVSTILKNRNATKKDLEKARSNINQMKILLAEMQDENKGLETEKYRLQTTLDQLSNEMVYLQTSMEKLDRENKELAQTVSMASVFVISDLVFKVVNVKRNKKETATSQVTKADKMIIHFFVKNHILHLPSTDVYLVVTDPSGLVVQNPVWNSGNFSTSKYGKLAFTIRDHFNYEKGSSKNIVYTLAPAKFIQGEYKLQVFHNGVEIGKAIQQLQ